LIPKFLVFLFLLFLNGCSIDELRVWGELDKVHIVKQNTYVKYYRAYFRRSHLKPIRHGRKYLYFYHRKTKDLAILLHPENQYILYSFSHPNTTIKISSDRRHGYRYMLGILKQKGYSIASPHRIGYTATLSLRRYKKVKTYRVEVKDYRRLLALYRTAISHYDAQKIKGVTTRLPKVLIEGYYRKYKANARTKSEINAMQRIAEKLHLAAETSETATRQPYHTSPASQNWVQRYAYYFNHASAEELERYLSSGEAKKELHPTQYAALQKRSSRMKEQKLLREGSLEELITAYKANNNPRYKAKIMQRIKVLQQNN